MDIVDEQARRLLLLFAEVPVVDNYSLLQDQAVRLFFLIPPNKVATYTPRQNSDVRRVWGVLRDPAARDPMYDKYKKW
jgi:hypothetical protein